MLKALQLSITWCSHAYLTDSNKHGRFDRKMQKKNSNVSFMFSLKKQVKDVFLI